MSQGHVFISYSSRDRDVAELVQTQLEAGGRSVWIAPRDVPPGMSYPEAIINAIRDCGEGLLVLSEQSNCSPHVLREVERISSDHKPLYVLRIEDVHLSDGLAYFASLLQWLEAPRGQLTRDPAAVLRPLLDRRKVPPVRRVTGQDGTASTLGDDASELNFSALAEAQRRMLRTFGVAVLDYICQRPNPAEPVPRRELLGRLVQASPNVFDGLSPRQFDSLLSDAVAHGCAPGLSETTDGLFVIEENIAVKQERNQVAKALIARHAAKLVRSGMTIAVDGGSTTLPIVENILSGIETGDLDSVKIVTNSLTSAQTISQFMSRQGWTDDSSLVSLYLAGGHVRPNTHATTWGGNVEREQRELLDDLGSGEKPIDIGFIGGNGFDLRSGITMGTVEELGFKRFVLENSDEPHIVADSSKAGLSLKVQIADWADSFTLLTNVLDPEALTSLDELVLSGKIVEVRE